MWEGDWWCGESGLQVELGLVVVVVVVVVVVEEARAAEKARC